MEEWNKRTLKHIDYEEDNVKQWRGNATTWIWCWIRWNLIQPYPHPDWREIWQDCCTGSLALAAAERRNHHPEDRSPGTDAGESESLRLQT